MSMCISTAQARTKQALRSGHPACSLHFLHKKGSRDMSMCISTAQNMWLMGCGIFPVNVRIKGFVTCPCAFRLWTLAQNEKSHTEVLPRDPVYRDLRSCQDTSYGDLIQRHCVEVCCKDLSQVSYINLAQKAFVERESTEIS